MGLCHSTVEAEDVFQNEEVEDFQRQKTFIVAITYVYFKHIYLYF